MSPGSAPASTLAAVRDGRRPWADWLDGQGSPEWRPTEWDRRLWLFTGDLDSPGTAAWRCFTASCGTTVTARRTFCSTCQRAWAGSGQPRGEFAAAYAPSRVKAPRGAAPAPCLIARDGVRCARPAVGRGLCRRHYKSWNEAHRERSLAWDDWQAAAGPFTSALGCLVPGCPVGAMNEHGLCAFHSARFGREAPRPRDDAARAAWAARQTRYLTAEMFSLRTLDEVLRREVLHGLQVRDRTGRGVIDPSAMRVLSRALEGVDSLLGPAGAEALAGCTQVPRMIGKDLRWAAQRGFEQYSGILPTSKDIWDLREIGLKCKTRTGVRFHPGTADVREIAQPWLRSVLQRWVETRQPRSDKFGRTLRAVILASRALQSRPGGGRDPASLQFGDVNAVVDAFRSATRVDGSAVYSQAFRASLAGEFFALLDFGRQGGMLDGLSGAFARTPAVHRIKVDHGGEDETGKAIPGHVLAQLEQHLHLLGTAGTGKRVHGTGGMQDADREAMYQTIFLLLRDTGRRPEEIAALPRDCLEVNRGDVSLIWDNRKGRRRRRRLPITSGTAQAIRLWQAARDRLDAPAASSGYLFPALTHGSGTPHLPSQYISEAIRAWVAAIPRLEGEGTDAAGQRLPFNRSMIFPYAFRHTYAQRHADAGTPVDVLKELMDHRSVSTTMGQSRCR